MVSGLFNIFIPQYLTKIYFSSHNILQRYFFHPIISYKDIFLYLTYLRLLSKEDRLLLKINFLSSKNIFLLLKSMNILSGFWSSSSHQARACCRFLLLCSYFLQYNTEYRSFPWLSRVYRDTPARINQVQSFVCKYFWFLPHSWCRIRSDWPALQNTFYWWFPAAVRNTEHNSYQNFVT